MTPLLIDDEEVDRLRRYADEIGHPDTTTGGLAVLASDLLRRALDIEFGAERCMACGCIIEGEGVFDEEGTLCVRCGRPDDTNDRDHDARRSGQ